MYDLTKKKINDLQNIQWQVVNFWQSKKRLPNNLVELADPISSFIVPVDQQTGEEYGYSVISGLTFELCADFNKESTGASAINGRIAKPVPVNGGFGFEDTNWQHEEGEVCFERTIDPDLYPVRKDR